MFNPTIEDTSSKMLKGSKEWDEHLRLKVALRASGLDEHGWAIIAQIGPKIACPHCKALRWDDGTRCKGCNLYAWPDNLKLTPRFEK